MRLHPALKRRATKQRRVNPALEPVMNLSPIWRDFVDDARFNSPRMKLMRRINTDFYGKRWHSFEKNRGNPLHPRYLRRILTSDAAILAFEGGKVHNSLWARAGSESPLEGASFLARRFTSGAPGATRP